MLILALDTTTRAGSAAILRGEEVLHEMTGDPAVTHAQRLPADLIELLERASVRVEEVELFAVAAGPGSFTGLRVGIATVQGLAMARGRRVAAVSVLDALAASVEGAPGPIGALMDAQRGQVFGALYAREAGAPIAPPTSLPPADTLERWSAQTDLAAVTYVGDGAVRYQDVLAARVGPGVTIRPAPALAPIIGRIAARDPGRAVLPHAVVPIYVRPPDAELARTRKLAGEG